MESEQETVESTSDSTQVEQEVSEEYSGELIQDFVISPFGVSVNNPSRYTGTGGYANGYFTGWSINGGSIDPVAMSRNYGRDMDIILNQLNRSFGAVMATLEPVRKLANQNEIDIESNYRAIDGLDVRLKSAATMTWVANNYASKDVTDSLDARLKTTATMTWIGQNYTSKAALANTENYFTGITNGLDNRLKQAATMTWVGENYASKNVTNGLDSRLKQAATMTWVGENYASKDVTNGLDSRLKQAATMTWVGENYVSKDVLDNFEDKQNTWNIIQLSNNISQGNRIKALEDEINNFNLSDMIDLTVVVTAINSFKKAYEDSLKENGLMYNLIRGAITGQTTALTGQFSELKQSIQAQFDIYFGDWETGLFWIAATKLSRRNMAIFFEILEEDFFETYWIKQLETWNVTNGFLETSTGWLDMIHDQVKESRNILAIITQWLEKIYQKPGAIVTSIPFDYNRLQTMLDGLKFGDIINESGTTIWDFLRELVEQLGLTLRDILDFLDNLLDKIIALIVPDSTSFIGEGFNGIKVKFNVKFGAFLGLADDVKNIFTPTSKDFKQSVSFNLLGAKFEPDFSMIDEYVAKFRTVMSLSIWMSVAIYVFRKITGNGDLINDN